MPRTKQTRKNKNAADLLEESEGLVKDFNKKASLRVHNMESDFKMMIKALETEIDIAFSRFSPEISKLTLGEILMGDNNKENEENDCEVVSAVHNKSPSPPPQSTMKTKKNRKRTTATSDDGYVTEGGTAITRQSRVKTTNRDTKSKATRTTRSSSRNNQKKLSEAPKFADSRFKTPAMMKPQANEYDLVTPKVKPNTPLSVMRRPRQGEMALSMQGSPLLVSAVVQDRTANINVPLHDGNVMSLLPNDGLRLSHIPNLDPETMRQLKTLKSHIEKVIGSK